MNEVELAIYRHLSPSFSDLMDVFRERNPEATFYEALTWTGAIIVSEQKIRDQIIVELPPLEERNGI